MNVAVAVMPELRIQMVIRLPETLKEKLARAVANGLLVCECTRCEQVVYLVEANMDILLCPKCLGDTLKTWAKVDVIEVKPE